MGSHLDTVFPCYGKPIWNPINGVKSCKHCIVAIDNFEPVDNVEPCMF